jgi:Arc/MetJ-type ribon-helix-helix transcriptional regulator
MSKKEQTNINFRVPPKMAIEIDRLVEEDLYSNRSEILRSALREFLVNRRQDGEV